MGNLFTDFGYYIFDAQGVIIFSRSYCHAVWSAINDIMMSSVCGTWVCPSVCLSVTLCIVVVRVRVDRRVARIFTARC